MIEQLPGWINLLFIATCLGTIFLFYLSNGQSILLTMLVTFWTVIHSVLAYTGFYQNMSAMPPRFALVLVPAIIFLVYSMLPKQLLRIHKHRDIRISTLLHIVRLPVELLLFQLFIHKMVPELMTFSCNF